MSSFNTPDESVQDTVAQLINQAANTDVVYNDANDTLTVSLTDSVSVNTLEAGGADTRFDFVSDVIGGTVAAGDAGPVWITTLADGETLNVTQAALTLDGGGAAPTGLDLIIGDLTNMTSETTLIDGDGTVQDDETGTPLGSYTNNSGVAEQVAVLIDNGQFNAGTGNNQDAIGSFIGRVA